MGLTWCLFLTQYRPGFKIDLVPNSWNDLFYSHSTLKIPTISPFSESRHFRHIQHAINPEYIERGLKCCFVLTHYRSGFKINVVPKCWTYSFNSHSTLNIPFSTPFLESRHFRYIQHVIKPRNIERGLSCCVFLPEYRPRFRIDLVLNSWNDLFYSHSTFKIPSISPFS